MGIGTPLVDKTSVAIAGESFREIPLLSQLNVPDVLRLDTVSALYRHSILFKFLRVRVTELPQVFAIYGNPFVSAAATLSLLTRWTELEAAGLDFNKLAFVVADDENPLRPLSLSQRATLLLSKKLYDGLGAIWLAHPDLPTDNNDNGGIDTPLLRGKAALLFDAPIVEDIVGLIDGTTVYSTNAPAGLSITVPESLLGRLIYTTRQSNGSPSAVLKITGRLTPPLLDIAKSLSHDSAWLAAINRVDKQARRFFGDVLSGLFAGEEESAKTILLAGDVNDPQNPDAPENTASVKRRYLLKTLLPILRKRLSQRLIAAEVAAATGLNEPLAGALLTEVLASGNPAAPAMHVFESLREKPATDAGSFSGYLIPPRTDTYTFIVTNRDTQPSAVLDGLRLDFPTQQEDPSDVWISEPVLLHAGTLSPISLPFPAANLQWKTAITPRTAVPASALLPDYASTAIATALRQVSKCASLINSLSLTLDELRYLHNHAADFSGLDFNQLTLPQVLRLLAYVQVRGRVSGGAQGLLDLFAWASQTDTQDNPAILGTRVAAALGMETSRVSSLLASDHFNLNTSAHFVNEMHLAKLLDASHIADKTAVDIERLFTWAKPGSQFWPMHRIAQDIRHITRARFEQSDWEQVVKPLSDTLRAKQRDALIAYLLVQPELREWGVIDADSLFEFFLIDVQMEPCMETSRIKQAISSVQLFIQRCLLGLESGVGHSVLNRERWEWMQRYRVWEANRKVFLYPENWIRSELRDDKSPFFKELESELLQRDLTEHNVEEAFKSYVFKVDGVAYLKVVGLYEELDKKVLHVFARTRNAPYQFYYRTKGTETGYWTPWELMQVDIPSYETEETEDEPKIFGTYLAPIVANGRLLVFFPQFMKKTEAAKVTITGESGERAPTIEELGKSPFADTGISEFWEIKLCWTEYRSGRWTQKQLSTEAVSDFRPESKEEPIEDVGSYQLTRKILPKISNYQFIPREEDTSVAIDVYRYPADDAPTNNKSVVKFIFKNGQMGKSNDHPTQSPTAKTIFHYNESPSTIKSLQSDGSSCVFTETTNDVQVSNGQTLTHKDADILVAGSRYLPTLLKALDDLPASVNLQDRFGGDAGNQYHELKSPSAIYNWEVDFHAPMLVVERLLESQQYEQALNMCHYVLNPFADGEDRARFWQFVPFMQVNPERVLERLFFSLQAGQPDTAITEWRNNPFQPHVVARSRPAAYMKWVAMKYIQILIAWGDHLFQQDTIETINQASQLYILASHAYGSKGQRIPKRGRTKPQTYFSLIDRWDAFSNAMVELELAFPFSNQPDAYDDGHDAAVALTNIFGSASALYFCIPDNPELTKLRETIDDRLFKIRHCQNIEGVFRKLPLFEPPIDPALLVQAAAQGLSIASVLSDLNAPMPNYRFPYLLQRAMEMCNEVKALGAAFLSAKEKGEGEALSQLRAVQERVMTQRLLDTRKLQLEEAEKSLESLRQSRTGSVYRLRHYLQLIGEDIAKIPGEGDDFTELQNSQLVPVDEGGLKLISFEKEELDQANAAQDRQREIGVVETLASILHAIPVASGDAKPFGIGAGVAIHGQMFGNATQAVARGLQVRASDISFGSSNAGKKGGLTRVLQDRIMQANSAGYELMNIDKQITTQQIRLAMAQWELETQQKQIDHAQEIEDFLQNKYTNRELYAWMEAQVRNIYYQAYTLAYELAKRAESAFCFERGLATSDFVRAGYWEAGRDGLFAGENLYLALKQMERAYQERKGHDFEVTKTVSLRQLNPFAFLTLRETGVCEFTLPEVLFDLDYPGHFRRQIKSVALSIPCIVGPYTNLNCTLRLLEHKYRIKSLAQSADDYLEKVESDDRFQTVRVPISSIAASSAQGDSGVFELSFRDERYLPFEGAGVISKWRLELPSTIRQFDYSSISDVVMQVRYVASDGGDKLKGIASQAALKYLAAVETESREEGLFALIDLKHDYATEWYRAMNATDEVRTVVLKDVLRHFPFFASNGSRQAKAANVYLFSSEILDGVSLAEGTGDAAAFTAGAAIAGLNTAAVTEINMGLTEWRFQFNAPSSIPREMFLLVNYTLT
ncbi:neuraminidase-like domain-containing protein [Thiothrix nivea]|nr:neuraminidase-like domain-containing protein [Thiothrix nivea]